MKAILFDTEQTAETFFSPQWTDAPRAQPCDFKERRGDVHVAEEQPQREQKDRTPDPPPVLIHHTWRRLLCVGEAQTSIMWRDAVFGRARRSHRRFFGFFARAPPLVVISFYNQHMQIRNGQPIHHSPAAEY